LPEVNHYFKGHSAKSDNSSKDIYVWLLIFISPPGSDSFRDRLMFYCRCFIFQLRDLQDGSADRRKILHGDQQ